MSNVIPYRSNAVPSASTPNPDRYKELAGTGAGLAAASAVGFGLSSLALKGLVAAGVTAATLATLSPVPATALASIVALEASTGFPVTRAVFAAAAFALTRWGTKSMIAGAAAIKEAFETAWELGGKLVTGLKDMAGSMSPSPASLRNVLPLPAQQQPAV